MLRAFVHYRRLPVVALDDVRGTGVYHSPLVAGVLALCGLVAMYGLALQYEPIQDRLVGGRRKSSRVAAQRN